MSTPKKADEVPLCERNKEKRMTKLNKLRYNVKHIQFNLTFKAISFKEDWRDPMICSNCGNNISDDAKFCTACGTSMTSPQQTPAEQNQVTEQHATWSSPQPQNNQQAIPPTPIANPESTPHPTSFPTPISHFAPPVQATLSNPPAAVPQPQTPRETNNRIVFISLGIALIALVAAILGFIIPSHGSGALTVVNGGTAQIEVKAGEDFAKVKILPEKSNYIVVATAIGGDSKYGEVTFNNETGELFLFASKTPDETKFRSINWIACSK